MKIDFDKKQIELLDKLDLDFDATAEMTDDQYFEMYEKIVHRLQHYGIDDNELNEIGEECRVFLNFLADF